MANTDHTVVTPGGHLFRIVDGRRVWLTTPPPEYLKDALQDNLDDGRRGKSHV
jgi:hypothetical protein